MTTFVHGDDTLRRQLQSAVGGRFEIIRLLGRGGMGAVYLARDTLGRLVAVKVILPHAFVVPGARERFRREMRTVARFNHPNIVRVFTSGELDELDYFVMEYVSGDPIAERLRQEGRMPPEEVRRILVDLADALHYAHGLSVIHRDVKPANVLIDDLSGRVLLTDFGIAKTLNGAESQTTGVAAGTLGYMPPEAFSDGEIDHRADIYSLGVLGYEMIAGRRPFTGDNAFQLIHHTVNTPAPDLRSIVEDVPADLAGVVMRCLTKDPKGRARDARHLKAALGLKETDEVSMPQDLIDMAGFGSWTLLWISAWAALGLTTVEALSLRLTLLGIALVVPMGFALQVAGMRPGGLPKMQIARVAFWPPKWWGMWWPLRLRRPVDLWRFLPLRPRLTRIALSAFLISVPALIFLAPEVESRVAAAGSLVPVMTAIIGVLAAAVATVLIDGWVWARRSDLNGRETIRMLIGPTIVSRLWDSPRMSALLNHPHHRVEPDFDRVPEFPRQCLDCVVRLAPRLTGPSREAGMSAALAAREFWGEIESLDVEISNLTDASAEDVMAQLESQLKALPPGSGDDGVDDGSVEARIRKPLLKELDQLRRIEARLAAAKRERTRLFGTQLEIWRRLVELSKIDPNAAAAEPLRARIRRLCAGLEGPQDDDTPGDAPAGAPSVGPRTAMLPQAPGNRGESQSPVPLS